MKRFFILGILFTLLLSFLAFSTACNLKNCVVSIPLTATGTVTNTATHPLTNTATATSTSTSTNTATTTTTSTPTNTFTVTTTSTMTNTPTNTATITVTNTVTATATITSTCVTYSDNFSSNTLGNYDYFLNSSQTVSTAAGCDYTISGGLLTVDPTSSPGTNNGGLAVVDNSFFSHSLTHYTISATFEMDNTTDSEGLFGIAFRTGSNGSFYCFQWNANAGTDAWQIEANTGSPSVSFSYPGPSVFTNPYTLGTTITMQVVANGTNFICSVNQGSGFVQIFNVNDSTYTSGGVGVRTYGVHEGNKIQIGNFSVDTCP